MPVQETKFEAVVSGATTLALSQFFTVTAAAANPAYIVLDALDRNEYTAAANGDTGSFTGDNAQLGFSQSDSDGRSCGIVFTWQASSGQYVNATYGSLSQLSYTSSDSLNDVTNISLYGTSNLALAQADAASPYALMQADAGGYIGSVTVATQPGFTGTVPQAATPDGVVAAAMNFVGDAWNQEGCWVLASTIAAEAGASLPINSTAIGVKGVANGEWTVIYNGPAAANGSWQSLVSAGDMIAFATPGGGGHITTCVSGSGSTAKLVDNITYENGAGVITNPANDGSAADVLVAPPHLASQEFSGVAASSVVIYALDTPAIADASNSATLVSGKTLALSGLFTATDPAKHAITSYQIYDTATTDSLSLNGVTKSAHSASSALTENSLSGLSLLAGATPTTDTLEIRASNGTYWGDWQSLSVTVNAAPLLPPVLGTKTPNQTWYQAAKVSLILPAALFTDPQHEALVYSVAGANGAALPSWLAFNAATRVLSGTVPAGMENFSVVVTATDTSNLSASETFTVNVPAAAPVLAVREPAQTWAEGATISCQLPQGSFTDPQGQNLTVTATLSNGAALPSWLSFSAGTMTFSGTAPGKPQSVALKVTATDTSGLFASETFNAVIAAPSTHALVAGDFLPSSFAAPPPAYAMPVTEGGWSMQEAAHDIMPLAWAAHEAG
jgi:hypothetical protein